MSAPSPDVAAAKSDAGVRGGGAPPLDAQQRAVVAAVLERHENVFMTGTAGAGKSFTLRTLVAEARAAGLVVEVTSTTGRSAVELDLGATTLHSLFGIGKGEKSAASYVRDLHKPRMRAYLERLRALDVLVVDEISMAPAEVLEKVETILADVRRAPTVPWGGAQVVFSGDFFQLLPVPDTSPAAKRKRGGGRPERPALAFEAPRAWRGSAVHIYELETRHRQAEDAAFGELLGRMRRGELTPEDITTLRSRIVSRAAADALGDSVVRLYSRNAQVDAYNARRLARLSAATEHVYVYQSAVAPKQGAAARAPADVVRDGRAEMLRRMRVLPTTALREGARVMLLANVDLALGLANGSTGTVLGFTEPSPTLASLPIVAFDHGVTTTVAPRTWKFEAETEYRGSFTQLPLVLAYALTTHKAQGLTLRSVLIDCSPESQFDYHMAFVGVARATSLAGVHFSAFSSSAVRTLRKVREFYDAIAAA